jgi:transcriptional regulator with XRE-family HTH domain
MPSALTRKFGAHLKDLRKSRGLTQDALAERSGLAVDSIRRIERGAFSPSLDTLGKVARGLRLTLHGLFGYFDPQARDDVLELRDYLATCTLREVRVATRLVHALVEDRTKGKARRR